MTSNFQEFKERGRQLYRQLLKEDLERMKYLLTQIPWQARMVALIKKNDEEGKEAGEFDSQIKGEYETMLQDYKNLAANCLSWKRLIKLNK